jgi:hypothetical protein
MEFGTLHLLSGFQGKAFTLGGWSSEYDVLRTEAPQLPGLQPLPCPKASFPQIFLSTIPCIIVGVCSLIHRLNLGVRVCFNFHTAPAVKSAVYSLLRTYLALRIAALDHYSLRINSRWPCVVVSTGKHLAIENEPNVCLIFGLYGKELMLNKTEVGVRGLHSHIIEFLNIEMHLTQLFYINKQKSKLRIFSCNK